MTLGDYGLKSALLVVEKMTMKSNTDAVNAANSTLTTAQA